MSAVCNGVNLSPGSFCVPRHMSVLVSMCTSCVAMHGYFNYLSLISGYLWQTLVSFCNLIRITTCNAAVLGGIYRAGKCVHRCSWNVQCRDPEARRSQESSVLKLPMLKPEVYACIRGTCRVSCAMCFYREEVIVEVLCAGSGSVLRG